MLATTVGGTGNGDAGRVDGARRAAPGMEALFNLYYFCLFVTKNHLFVLYFLSGEEVGGNARDNRGTGAAMQCRWSAAAPGTGAARAACLGRDLSSALASIARRRSR